LRCQNEENNETADETTDETTNETTIKINGHRSYKTNENVDELISSSNKIIKIIKNKILFNPINNTDMDFIPSMFRYRLWLSENMTQQKINEINDEQTSLIMAYDDNFNIDGLSDTDMIGMIEKLSAEIKNNKKTQDNNVKIHVVIDLRLYGPDLYIHVYVGDVQYSLTDEQRFDIKKSWTKVK